MELYRTIHQRTQTPKEDSNVPPPSHPFSSFHHSFSWNFVFFEISSWETSLSIWKGVPKSFSYWEGSWVTPCTAPGSKRSTRQGRRGAPIHALSRHRSINLRRSPQPRRPSATQLACLAGGAFSLRSALYEKRRGVNKGASPGSQKEKEKREGQAPRVYVPPGRAQGREGGGE